MNSDCPSVPLDQPLPEGENDVKAKDTVTESRPCAPVVRSSTTVAFWQRTLGLAQVTKLRGNCWRKHGFSINNANFFYPEEVLYLFERGSLVVTKTLNGVDYMSKQELFEAVLQFIPLSCYLTYSRLKSLDYIVFRHKKTIHAFASSQALYDHIQQNPTLNLVDAMVSFDLFLEEEGFSKKSIKDKAPTSYVVVTESDTTFPVRVMLKLIDEANKVPVLISAISQSGFVILEEFTDAEKSLDLKNSKRNLKRIYSRPMMSRYVDLSIFEDDEGDHQTANGKTSRDDNKAEHPGSEGKKELESTHTDIVILNEKENEKENDNENEKENEKKAEPSMEISISLLGKRSFDEKENITVLY